MRYDSAIHTGRHLLKHALGRIESWIPGGDGSNDLLVVNYHGTPRKFLGDLREQLDYYSDRFVLMAPSDLCAFYESKLVPTARPRLLLTFDDGLKNNLDAAEILSSAGIRALFFVVPDFIDTPESEQPAFYQTRVREQINPAIASEIEDFTALSWRDLRSLKSEGHAIGSHSATHTLLATDDDEKSRYEIEGSRRRIAACLHSPLDEIDAYCSPNHTLRATGELQMRLVRESYRYFFTTFPGANEPGSDRMFIRRCNVETFWLNGAVTYSLGRLDRVRWRNQIAGYSRLVKGG